MKTGFVPALGTPLDEKGELLEDSYKKERDTPGYCSWASQNNNSCAPGWPPALPFNGYKNCDVSRRAHLGHSGSHAEKVKKLQCEPLAWFDVIWLTYRNLCKPF